MSEDVPAGATPVVPGATPGQTPPASSADPAPATGPEDDQDGAASSLSDPGKQALERMKAERNADRAARKALEAELEKLRTATLSETERAIAAAEAKGASEATAKADARTRKLEVRDALKDAGVNRDLLDVLVKSEEFAELVVTEDGVEGLQDAVAAFKKAKPSLFGPSATPGADLGAAGSPGRGVTLEQIKSMSLDEFDRRHDEVMAFVQQPKR